MLHKLITAFLFICIVFLTSCIEQYVPTIEISDINKYVVNGQLTDQEGFQYVTVSLASRLDDPEIQPLGNCNILIIDNNQNTFPLNEYDDGKYKVWMNKNDLTPGTKYKLKITTPASVVIESEFDEMPEVPPVDSVYFIRKNELTSNPELYHQGIQFYINYKGNDLNSRYVLWKLEETWEYRVEYPIEYYYDGQIFQVDPPDYSSFYCWKTEDVPEIFTVTTNELTANEYNKFPLHFVDNKTQRLAYGYSLLINQYGISEAAYNYWDELKNNNNGQGGLYEQQPIQVEGNLHNITNPETEVLGFFGASSITSKRIFVNPIDDLPLIYNNLCTDPDSLDRDGFDGFKPWPVYFLIIERRIRPVSIYCVKCELQGGVTKKPDYWPN